MKNILPLFFAVFLISACQSPTESQENTTVPASNPTAPVPVSSVAPSNNSDVSVKIPTHNPPHGQPHHDCAIAVGAPLAAAQETKAEVPVAKQVKLNPEHGQPGHRCDIEVGEPLP